jgi:hypothetical protein
MPGKSMSVLDGSRRAAWGDLTGGSFGEFRRDRAASAVAPQPYAVSKAGSVGVVIFTFNYSVRKILLSTAPALPRG